MTRRTGIIICAGTLIVFLVLLVGGVLCRTFFYQLFSLPSASMEPSLHQGSTMLATKFAYGYSRYAFPFDLPLFEGRILFREPKRGDVAIFRLPVDPSISYLKRIVGLPGDSVRMIHGQLYLNERPVARETDGSCRIALPRSAGHYQFYRETLPDGAGYCIMKFEGERLFDNTAVFHVPPGHYFMMGDNRDNSLDSRDPTGDVGYVPALNLVGRIDIVLFSPSTTRPE